MSAPAGMRPVVTTRLAILAAFRGNCVHIGHIHTRVAWHARSPVKKVDDLWFGRFAFEQSDLLKPLFVAQCHHRIDFHRPPRGHVCRSGCNRR
jgi:hypothetical protein